MSRIHLYIYIAMLSCMCMSSCTQQQDEWTEDNNISLRAEVENVTPATRSDKYAEPVSDNNLTATVWFSLEKGKFPEKIENPKDINNETNIPGHYIIDFMGETPVFPNVTDESLRPRYPIPSDDGTVTPVYCVGFYPHQGWNYIEGTEENHSTATHEITGFEDLMFAAPIEGNWNQHFDKQRFTHLLTWLKVCVCATTTEAGNYWGKLKKITLKDVPSGLQINNLSKMQNEYPDGKLTGDDVTPLKDSEGKKIENSPAILDNPDGIDLGVNIQDVGSIFCYPQSSYDIVVECANGKTKVIRIDLEALSGTVPAFPTGKQYVLILNFHPFDVVEGVCTLQEWNAQNENLYPDAQQ